MGTECSMKFLDGGAKLLSFLYFLVTRTVIWGTEMFDEITNLLAFLFFFLKKYIIIANWNARF